MYRHGNPTAVAEHFALDVPYRLDRPNARRRNVMRVPRMVNDSLSLLALTVSVHLI